MFFTNSNDFDTPVVSGNGTVLFDLRAPGGGPGIALLVWKDGTLTTIADDTGPLDSLSGLPSVNDNGTVVFWAGLDAGGNGIFTRSLAGGSIVPLVDDSGGFASFGQGVVVNGHGQVAFNANLDHGESGIFVTDGTAVVEFATSSGALPCSQMVL